MILLTGATGYVGGRLLRRLEERGCRVRCLARRPEFLRSRVGPQTEVVPGDVLEVASLESALRGVTTAYYLVHSIGTTGNFEEQDRQAARSATSVSAGKVIAKELLDRGDQWRGCMSEVGNHIRMIYGSALLGGMRIRLCPQIMPYEFLHSTGFHSIGTNCTASRMTMPVVSVFLIWMVVSISVCSSVVPMD